MDSGVGESFGRAVLSLLGGVSRLFGRRSTAAAAAAGGSFFLLQRDDGPWNFFFFPDSRSHQRGIESNHIESSRRARCHENDFNLLQGTE